LNIILSVSQLSKSFGGLKVLDDISFDVPEASITAIIGPNGAGKTTLFNIITNIYHADRGDVRFNGRSLSRLSPTQIAKLGIVRTFQTARIFPGLTVLDNVLIGGHLRVKSSLLKQACWLPSWRREQQRMIDTANSLLDLVGLIPWRDRSAVELPMGGQKQLEVIRAMMTGAHLFMLDEPAAGLNDAETAELAHLLRAMADNYHEIEKPGVQASPTQDTDQRRTPRGRPDDGVPRICEPC
jgi:branched-chain amino acid transport system ATP-binding protein